MPTKPLASRPNLAHLKHQAKDLRKAHVRGRPEANQRLREFHARFAHAREAAVQGERITLGDAQLAIAREYGFPSWPRLKAYVEHPERAHLDLPHHERIADPAFRRAVDLLDAGDTDELRAHLQAHPEVIHQRAVFEGGNYFQSPALLEFAAENPIRHGPCRPTSSRSRRPSSMPERKPIGPPSTRRSGSSLRARWRGNAERRSP